MGPLALVLLVLLAAAAPDLLPRGPLSAFPPDLWIAATAYLALRARGYRAVGWAIALGLAQDALSLDPLGTHAFVHGCVAWMFAEGARARGRIAGPLRLAWTFGATFVAGAVYLVRILPMGGAPPTLGAFVALLPRAGATALFAAFLFPLLDRSGALDDLCGRRHEMAR
jgi:rod shape-determining protein MreD